jgi:CHAD domain-containing protein
LIILRRAIILRTAHGAKKIPTPMRKAKPKAQPFSALLSAKLNEIAKLFKSFDGKLTRREIHRLRVGTRRLQAILEVLRDGAQSRLAKKTQGSVKFLTNQLGYIRSLDVSRKLWKSRFSLAGVDQKLKIDAREARRDLEKKIGKKEKASLEKALRKIRNSLPPSSDSNRQAWEKQRAKAERRATRCYEAYLVKPDIETLHELRIRLKQWRYLLELADPKTAVSSEVATLKVLQDDIGRLHDKKVLHELLKKPRFKRLVRKAKAGHDLKEIRRDLKAEIKAGQRTFLTRQSQALARIFPKEKA